LNAAQGMKYRRLGATGLNVSTVSLGCAPLGNVYGDISSEESQRIVEICINRGINFLDTSPYYGQTVSESVLGKCLRNIPREKYILASKVGRYEVSDFSESRVRKSVQESLNRLQTDYIDLMQCHDVEFASSIDQVIHEALPVLNEYKEKGIIRHVGISGLPLPVIDFVLDNSHVDVETVLSYCCYCLNNTNLQMYIPRWKFQGIGIIQGGSTSMGLLTNHGPQPWHPAPDALRDSCKRAAELVKSLGSDIAKLAFQYTHAQPDISTTLIGITSVEQLNNSLQWAHEPLDQFLLQEVEGTLAEIKNKIWVEKGSEENIALSVGGFYAKGRQKERYITGASTNLGTTEKNTCV